MSVRIITGDCRDVLKTLADGSVDCVITDPPYGETSLGWDQRVDGWLSEIERVLASHGSLWCFGSLRFFVERAGDFARWKLAQDLVWEKHNGTNAFNDRFRRVHEGAAQFYPASREWRGIYKHPVFTSDATARTVRRKSRPPQWGDIAEATYRSEDGGPRLMRSVMFCRSEHGRAVHPTQKPVACILPLIEYSCPPGGVVADPFAGSGTTGVAARMLQRSFLGIELNPDYAAMAERRIRNDASLLAEVAS